MKINVIGKMEKVDYENTLLKLLQERQWICCVLARY